MADYYKLVGSEENSTADWTTTVVLEKDDDGEVTKSVGVNKPAQLNADDLEKLKGLGLKVEKSSKAEAEKIALAASAAGGDAAASAPILGDAPSGSESK